MFQIPLQHQKISEPIRKESPQKQSAGLFVDIKSLPAKKDKTVSKPVQKQVSIVDMQKSKSQDHRTKTLEMIQKEIKLLYPQMSIEQINSLMLDANFPVAGPSKSSKYSSPTTSYKSPPKAPVPTHSIPKSTGAVLKRPEVSVTKKQVTFAKADQLGREMHRPTPSTSVKKKPALEADVICIDD